MARKPIDIKRRRFGSWLVLSYAGSARWNCLCDCGTRKSVAGHHLKSGQSTCCGSCNSHGMVGTPVYYTWQNMLARCRNPNHKNYSRYGGRGIAVCESWSGFPNFYSDMGDRPSPKHTLDRIDNDGDYTPENCRWATRREQSNNISANRCISYQGETLTATQWARRKEINPRTLIARLEAGDSPEKALNAPVHKGPDGHLITHDGKTQNISGWARDIGIKPKTLYERLRKGWPVSRALNGKLRTNQHG